MWHRIVLLLLFINSFIVLRAWAAEQVVAVPSNVLWDEYLVAPRRCASSSLTVAAQQNKKLITHLDWVISGKLQKGWGIYYPLIAQFLHTKAPAGSTEFADAVRVWQMVSGCRTPADGVLESTTLMSIILALQAQRFEGPQQPGDEKNLVTVKPSYVFDQKKDRSKRRLGKATLAAYDQMVTAARKDGVRGDFLKIISGYRSDQEQAVLRARSPGTRQSQLAQHSVHSRGRAIDIYVGGNAVSSDDKNRELQSKTRAYLWLVKNAKRFGFVPYYFEPWHWEYVGTASE